MACAWRRRAFTVICDASAEGKHSMNVSLEIAERPRAASSTDFEAIIIGAGISGIFMLYRLRELGMTARVF